MQIFPKLFPLFGVSNRKDEYVYYLSVCYIYPTNLMLFNLIFLIFCEEYEYNSPY